MRNRGDMRKTNRGGKKIKWGVNHVSEGGSFGGEELLLPLLGHAACHFSARITGKVSMCVFSFLTGSISSWLLFHISHLPYAHMESYI